VLLLLSSRALSSRRTGSWPQFYQMWSDTAGLPVPMRSGPWRGCGRSGAMLRGLADAVRRNDLSAAGRYCERLRLSAEQLAADEPLQNALEKLLLASGLWIKAAEADRNEARQQMLEVINRVTGLLTS
jgi:hypothetical protein